MRITNRQKLLTFFCLLPFILTLRPGLIMSKTSDDSLLAPGMGNIFLITGPPLNQGSSPLHQYKVRGF